MTLEIRNQIEPNLESPGCVGSTLFLCTLQLRPEISCHHALMYSKNPSQKNEQITQEE